MTKSRDTTNTYSKATVACFAVLVGMIFLYLYFLNLSVMQVVLRTDFTSQQSALQTEIALLEADYIDAQHTIVARIATLDGYDRDVEKIFVSRDVTNLAVRGTD